MSDLTLPSYDFSSLVGVLPRVAESLGGPTLPDSWAAARLPAAQRAVVILADGLGLDLLRERSGHAPFLRSMLAQQDSSIDPELTAGFPSTTATSMGAFGTGLPTGRHGLVGYQVRVPGADRVFNELDWVGGPDPLTWQPHPTLFQRSAEHGVACAMVGPEKFDGSGLTRAALRGARFHEAQGLDSAIETAVAAVLAQRRSLVYLYWGKIDSTGHEFGCGSWQWGEALEQFDSAVRHLAARLPQGTSLTITADHGMIDIPEQNRLDLALDAELRDGVQLTGGEPRAPQLYCEPGRAAQVEQRWRERFGEQAWVRSRESAVAAGWFGDVDASVLPRIGDVVVAMKDPISVGDSRVMRPRVLQFPGQHGSLTAAEQHVPMLHRPAV